MLQVRVYSKILASVLFSMISISANAEKVSSWDLDFEKTRSCKPESDICETQVILKRQTLEHTILITKTKTMLCQCQNLFGQANVSKDKSTGA